MMRILAASFIAAVALFFFGFVWWGLLMPVVQPAGVITDQELVDKMSSTLAESNLYIYPDYAQEPGGEGPMAFVFFNRDMPSMGKMMGMGFAHMFVTALFATLLVSWSPLRSFSTRVVFVFCLGLFVALWADIGNMIWWRHPPLWSFFHFGYDALSWLLAGTVIASIAKPNEQSVPSPQEDA